MKALLSLPLFFVVRDETFQRSLAKLRSDLVYANGLAREANLFAEERGKDVRFGVTLQIPPHNLTPNRKVTIPRHLARDVAIKIITFILVLVFKFCSKYIF